jgi:hypothetical protein
MVQSKVKSKSKSRYDRRPANQYVLVPSPLGIKGIPSEKFQFDIRRCTLRRNCWCYHWEGCMRNMQWNVEFGYQLSIYSGTKENHGKSWSGFEVEVTLRLTVEVKVTLRLTVSQYVLVSSTLVVLATRYYLLSEIWGLVSIGRRLLREDGSAICSVITQ